VKKQSEEANGKREEERKQKFREKLIRLIGQIKSGCKKDICASKFCKKNPVCMK